MIILQSERLARPKRIRDLMCNMGAYRVDQQQASGLNVRKKHNKNNGLNRWIVDFLNCDLDSR